jgi:ZIP family zinc transporter
LTVFIGFSSGAVIGVALFDLLPEALEAARQIQSPRVVTTAVGAGFAAYLLLDRLPRFLQPGSSSRGHLGPGSLTAHSVMDGFAIGFAFQASATVGWVVALAVLAHDFLDGANTVTLSLDANPSEKRARQWLAADAAAPIVGIALSNFVAVSGGALSLLLGVFCGFFLYIGASELLPRSDAGTPRLSTLGATLLGMTFIFLVVRLSGA